MNFYRSGATSDLSQQKDNSKSLGGFCSSDLMDFNNLFSTPSIVNDVQETYCFFLKNDTMQEAKNISFYYEKREDDVCEFEFWAAKPLDGKGAEILQSPQHTPIYATKPTQKGFIVFSYNIVTITKFVKTIDWSCVMLDFETDPLTPEIAEGTEDDFLNWVIEQINSNSENYSAEKYFGVENSFIVRKTNSFDNNNLGNFSVAQTGNEFEFTTKYDNFIGSQNKQISLISSLLPKEKVAIFVKRNLFTEKVNAINRDSQKYIFNTKFNIEYEV